MIAGSQQGNPWTVSLARWCSGLPPFLSESSPSQRKTEPGSANETREAIAKSRPSPGYKAKGQVPWPLTPRAHTGSVDRPGAPECGGAVRVPGIPKALSDSENEKIPLMASGFTQERCQCREPPVWTPKNQVRGAAANSAAACIPPRRLRILAVLPCRLGQLPIGSVFICRAPWTAYWPASSPACG